MPYIGADRAADAHPTIDWDALDAVLFDLDGVLTPTADIHERAWKSMFDDFLAARATAGPGRRSAATTTSPTSTASRGSTACARSSPRGASTCPTATADDPPGHDTVGALGNAKNDGVPADPAPRRHRPLSRLGRGCSTPSTERGTPSAVVSSSRNAAEVLDAAGLADRFERRRRRQRARRRADLPGKPAPDMFLARRRATRRRRRRAPSSSRTPSPASPPAAPAPSALVVGVDRGAGHEALLANGADVVVDDLAELLPTGRTGRR